MLVPVSTPTSAAELRALYRHTRAYFAPKQPTATAPSAPTAPRRARPAERPTDQPPARFSGHATLHLVARHFHLRPETLTGPSRLARHVLARRVVMHICVEAGGCTATRAGRLLRRDHTTVIHGLRKFAARLASDSALAAEVERLTWQCLPAAEAMEEAAAAGQGHA